MTLTFFLGLLSALLIAAAFRHLATKPSFYFACLYLFCCFLTPWLLPSHRYCFRCLVCRAVLRFSPPFFILAAIFCHAIFNAAIHFIAVQPAISRLFIQGWTLSCCFCSGPIVAIFILLLKMFSLRLQVAAPFFFVAFEVVVLLVILTPSCCSYCHCSTSSNSHTVDVAGF